MPDGFPDTVQFSWSAVAGFCISPLKQDHRRLEALDNLSGGAADGVNRGWPRGCRPNVRYRAG